MTTKQQLKTYPKKHLVKLAGYNNIKALCRDVPSMVRSTKKDIIKYIA